MGDHDATDERPAFRPGELLAGSGQAWPDYPPPMTATAVHPYPAFPDDDAIAPAPPRQYAEQPYRPGSEPRRLRRQWPKFLALGVLAGIVGAIVFIGSYTPTPPISDVAPPTQQLPAVPPVSTKQHPVTRTAHPPTPRTAASQSIRPPASSAQSTVPPSTPICVPAPLCPPSGGQ